MKQNIKFLILFLLACGALALFGSCSAKWHLAQAKKKAPELFQRDTLIVHDTSYIKAVSKDTAFYFMQKDTVVLKQDRLQIKYFYNNDSVFLSGTCADTTIIKEISVPVEKTIMVEGEQPKWVWPVIIVMAAFIILLLIFRR